MLDSVIHQKQCQKPVSEYCSGNATILDLLVPSFFEVASSESQEEDNGNTNPKEVHS